ncbi:MAG: energy-coupling factor ABC transporter permease [Gemmatales bacterium]
MLLAVHIADGSLMPITLGLGLVCMVPLLLLGWFHLEEKDVARTGVLTAVLFVASLIHPPIPGAKVHLLLNAMAGILLGRHAGLAVTVALVLQALLLSHGGLYAVGVNSTTIGLPAVLVAFLYAVLRRAMGLNTRWKRYIIGGGLAFVGVMGTLVLYYLTMRFGSIQDEDLSLLASIAFVWHIPVLIIEIIFTALLVDFLYKIKPELLGVRH